MKRNSTLKDVAEAAGVGQATASYVLSNSPKAISQETRERVLRAARTLSYQPNLAARTLVTGRTKIIRVWMPTLYTPFYAQTLHSLERQITDHGYTMTIQRTNEHIADLAGLLAQSAMDGLLMVDVIKNGQLAPKYDSARRLPIVFVGAHSPTEADYVGVDLSVGTRLAVRHLLDQGCRRPAYLASKSMCHPGEARFDAYRAAMQDAGLEPWILTISIGERATARQWLANYLRANDCPEGLFCQNDDIALGAFRALRDAGRRIPEDVALIGCDGIDETEYLDPPFSTIATPTEEMCALAWRFLARRIAEPGASPMQATLPAPLVVRESSRRNGR